MTRAERSGRRLVWLIAPAVLLLVGLGSWQLHRLQWKTALLAEIEARMTAPPIPLDSLDLSAGGDALAYRQVAGTGRYRDDARFPVVPRTYKGRPGAHLVTPFAVAGGPVLLVNRGWIPDPHETPIAAPAGPVTVTGVLRPAREPNWFTPENRPAQGAWYWIDPVAMAAVAGVDPAPVHIALVAQEPPQDLPIPVGVNLAIRNDHLGYALTWYALAAAALVIGVLLHRQRRNSTR